LGVREGPRERALRTFRDFNQTTDKEYQMPNLRRSNLGLLAVAAIVASFSVVPAAALAQDPLSNPSHAMYNAPIPGGGVAGANGAGQSAGQPAPAAQSAAGQATPGGQGSNSNLGSLPFTGMDLIILAGVALALTGTGLALRRLSMPRGPRV
jgi:hypothetical protein